MRKWKGFLDEEAALGVMNECGVGGRMEVKYRRGCNLFNVEG